MTLAMGEIGSEGWLGRIDARWKIVGTAIAFAATACLSDPICAAAAAAGAAVLAVGGGAPARRWIGRVAPILGMLILFFGWSAFGTEPGEPVWSVCGFLVSPTRGRLVLALLFKTAALVTLVFAVVETTPLAELAKASASLGAPRIVVQLAMMSHRYAFVLAEEFARLRRALRARGYRAGLDRRSFATVGSVCGMLFVRGHERAERVAHAMSARGFDGAFRTLSTSRTRWFDVAFAGVALVAGLGLVAWDWGWLNA